MTAPMLWSVGRAIAKALQSSVLVNTCSWIVARGSFIRPLVCKMCAELGSVAFFFHFVSALFFFLFYFSTFHFFFFSQQVVRS